MIAMSINSSRRTWDNLRVVRKLLPLKQHSNSKSILDGLRSTDFSSFIKFRQNGAEIAPGCDSDTEVHHYKSEYGRHVCL